MLSSFGRDELHTVAEIAERLPHRFFVGRDHDEHAVVALALRCGGRASRAPRSRPWCAARSMPHSSTTSTLPSDGAVGERGAQCEADHLLGGALRCSRAASGRAPRHRHASAARGSSPAGRGRCPSGATASHRRRGPRLASWCCCVPERAAASCAVTTWCITGTFGLDPEQVVGHVDRSRRSTPRATSRRAS